MRALRLLAACLTVVPLAARAQGVPADTARGRQATDTTRGKQPADTTGRKTAADLFGPYADLGLVLNGRL
ncbi:MAG: hypothetical protein H3C62_18585, partial [Gemmatimonadaceae bacterium]|nr:hypothetical protein [Gemmatimonadaceae bacterium]